MLTADNIAQVSAWSGVKPGWYVASGDTQNPRLNNANFFGDNEKAAKTFARFLNSQRIFHCKLPGRLTAK